MVSLVEREQKIQKAEKNKEGILKAEKQVVKD